MTLEYPGVTGSGEIWLDVIRIICGDTSNMSMVDLMCHHAPYTSQLGFKERTYVDILDRGLDNKDEQQYFIQSDVHLFLFENSHLIWDVSICSDGIEHLPKQSGWDLTWSMKLTSKKQIIFTPTGDNNLAKDAHPDTHKSAWLPNDFKGYGIINFPNFHPEINLGAFFAFLCADVESEFERIKSELNNKSWAK